MEGSNNLKILVIDDNPEIHKDFIKILMHDNSNKEELDKFEEIFGAEEKSKKDLFPAFQIDTASQGKEGVERISQALKKNDPYALAFVDIRMPPGWDGIETIKHIWKVDPDIQIVICTAYSDYTWEQTVQELGQRENLLILKKPFDQVAVRQLSCALTKKWQLLQETRHYTRSLEDTVKARTDLLNESLSIARGTLESTADGIVVVDHENKIIDYNQNFLKLFHVPDSIMKNKDGSALLECIFTQLEKPQDFQMVFQKSVHENNPLHFEKLKTADNRVFEHYSQPYKLNGAVAGRIWSFRDISRRAALEDTLAYRATHDTLTGLPNRALLADRITQAIAFSERNESMFAILFIDLDRFKLINDSFSHTIGDQLLQTVAQRIQLSIRNSDTMARFGGDEFVGLFPLADANSTSTITRKIMQVFREPFDLSKHKIVISGSVGISIFPNDGKTLDELLANADIAMYRAKEMGGNQVQFYSPAINKNTIERIELEADLHAALEKNEFILHYQPELDLQTKNILSVEALIRWQHPKKGLLYPIDFIPLAEEAGFILNIGNWVMRQACKQNKEWQDKGYAKIRVNVNVASAQFNHPNFVDHVKKALEESGLAPEYLELELTENLLIRRKGAEKIVMDLRNLGVKISLDDFGMGYSSLNYLRDIHVDRLKIDKSFVNKIDRNRDDEVIIQAIISMAKALNLETVAEGVETQKQLEFLKARECPEGQGFLFSKPVSKEEIENLFKSIRENEK